MLVAKDRQAAWLALEQSPGVAGQDYDPQRIMVVYAPGATLPANWPPQAGLAAISSTAPNPQLRQNKQYEALTDALAARYGLSISQQVYLQGLNFASFTLPAGANGAALLQQIRADAGAMLTSAIFVPLKHASYTSNDPDFASGPSGQQWSHWRVNCDNAWDITKGSASVIVAVVDTGVRLTHEELSAQVINPQTAFPSATCDLANNNKDIEDTDGHGTFIAGMIAAQQDNSRTITGVAPQCRVLPIKISNDGNAGVDTLIAGALLAGQLGAKVVNYSWGGYDDIPAEEAMIDQLTGNGVLFVCAAGNDGVEADEYPSYFTNAFSVGATDISDNATSFSNWGLSVDIAAPGEDLKSCACTSNSGYDSAGAGTSFAAPMVAAGAGLLWSYRPELTLQQVRNALQFQGPSASGFLLPIRRVDLAAALDSVLIHLTPSVAGVTPSTRTSIGTVPGSGFLDLGVTGPVNVTRVDYRLDLAPIGTDGPEDLTVASVLPGTFAAQLDLRSLKNQPAALRADLTSSTNDTASTTVQPLWVFNQRGDLDGDGLVGSADLLMLTIHKGETVTDSGFMGYIDSDRDGTITEADAAAVGYFYGSGAIAPEVTAVTPTSGTTGASAAFTATLTGSGQLTYEWNFGGGATPNLSAQPAPTVTLGAVGSYSASVTVTNEFGLTDMYGFTLDVQPRPGPTASFTANPTSGIAPLSVDFDATASSSPGGTIVQYRWSWDGDTIWEHTDIIPTANHVFSSIGSTTVRLSTMDDQGASDDFTGQIDIQPRPGPTARLTSTPSAGAPPLTVDFDASGSGSPGGSIMQYDWSWDGDTVWEDTTTGGTNSHLFPDLGDFTVRLRVTDDLSATAETTKLIRVTDGPPISGWGETSLGLWGQGISSDDMRISSTQVGGCPAVIWQWVDPADINSVEVYVAVANTPTPESLSDWRIDMVDSYSIDQEDVGICDINGEAAFVYRKKGTNKLSFGRYHGDVPSIYSLVTVTGQNCTLANVNGLPSILYGGSTLRYAYPNSSDPASSADWTFITLSGVPGASSPYSYAYDLVDVGGKPFFSHNSVGDNIGIWYATSSTPSSTDWLCLDLPGEHTGSVGTEFNAVFTASALPSILYYRKQSDVTTRSYSRTLTPTPLTEADLVTYSPPSQNGYISSSATIAGRPAYACNQTVFWAVTQDPSSDSDWIEIDAPKYGSHGRLLDHGGLPSFISTAGFPGPTEVIYYYPIS